VTILNFLIIWTHNRQLSSARLPPRVVFFGLFLGSVGGFWFFLFFAVFFFYFLRSSFFYRSPSARGWRAFGAPFFAVFFL